MSLKITDLQDQEIEHGRKNGDASLGGIPGTGTLQVVRNQNGSLIEVTGSWRANEGIDVGKLEQAAEEGAPLRYEGRFYDPFDRDRDRIVTDVVVSSYGTYRFDARIPDEAEQEGPVQTVFNFKPTEEIAS